MATSNDKIEITAEEMLAYRDETVKALESSSELLDQAQDAGIIEAKQGEHNRIMTAEQLPELKKIIQNEIEKLQHFDVVLAVVGTMKAGKSTTINAIVGREIMPNRNQPMTTLPTLIYHTSEQTTPKLFFVADPANDFVKEIRTILSQNPFWLEKSDLQAKEMRAIIERIQQNQCNFKSAYLGSDEIFAFLEQLNDLVRLSGHLSVQFPFEKYKEIEQLPKIEVAFTHLAHADSTNGRLVLLDTPGPDEAKQEHLKKILREQLERSSAVLLVVDYTKMNSEAGENVKKEIENLPALKAERLFVFVNKFDESKKRHSLTEEETKKYVQNVLLPKIKEKEQVKAENIFPISAYDAFIANRMQLELDNNQGKKPEYSQEWVKYFAQQIHRTHAEKKWEKMTYKEIQEESIALLEDSKIEAPMKKVIQNTHKNAPQIAISTALSKCQNVLENLHNVSNVWATTLGKTEEEINELKQTIAECQNDINQLKYLEQRVQKEVQGIQQTATEEITKQQEKAQKEIQQYIDELMQGQISKLEKSERQLSEDTRFFRLDNDYNEKKHNLEYVQDKLKESKKNISFDDKDAARQFCEDVAKQYDTVVQAIYKDLEETINNQLKQIDEQLKNTENETQQVFKQALDHLGKAGFDLQLSIPEIGNFSPLPQNNLDSSIKIEKKTREYHVKSDGFGFVKRGFGWVAEKLGYDNDWGYEKRTREFFNISKEKLHNTLKQAVEKVTQSINEEIERVLNAFNDDWVKNYIGTVQNKVNEVLGEINTAITRHNKSKEEKETQQAAVQKINDRYLEMNSTLKMVRDNVCPELK